MITQHNFHFFLQYVRETILLFWQILLLNDTLWNSNWCMIIIHWLHLQWAQVLRLARLKTWTCKIFLARHELQDLQDKNSLKTLFFGPKMEYFQKIVQTRVAKKILIIFFMFERPLFRKYSCFIYQLPFIVILMAENLNFMSKNGIYLSLASLASLARNPEFSLASRKT